MKNRNIRPHPSPQSIRCLSAPRTAFLALVCSGALLSSAQAAIRSKSGTTLNSDLNVANQRVTVVSTGTTYTFTLNEANLEYTYTRSTAAKDNGVTYQIEWSETLEAGSWSTETVTQEITSNQEALETVKASVPKGTSGKRFLRLRVSAAAGN
jgi:hypothetical protein